MKTSASVSVGSGPSETRNSWNWPGATFTPASAVQVILATASLTSLPWTLIGLSSLAFSTVEVQPGSGWVRTEASGWSSGRLTSSFTVPAASFSFGTRKSTAV